MKEAQGTETAAARFVRLEACMPRHFPYFFLSSETAPDHDSPTTPRCAASHHATTERHTVTTAQLSTTPLSTAPQHTSPLSRCIELLDSSLLHAAG